MHVQQTIPKRLVTREHAPGTRVDRLKPACGCTPVDMKSGGEGLNDEHKGNLESTFRLKRELSGEPGLLLRLIRDQRVAFLVVGLINTVIGFSFFVVLDLTLGRFIDRNVNTVTGSLVTLASAHVLSVVAAFILYRRFVFRVKGHVWRDLSRFESVYLVSLGINAVALPILVEFGLNRILAQAGILVLTTAISYLGHRHFSFRRKPNDSTALPYSYLD